MSQPRVVVIGGGLAGMTVAKELRKRAFDVVLLESSDRLGGKAGAYHEGNEYVEHGYHVFAGWYRNTRALLRDIQADQNLIDTHQFYVLRKGDYPNFVALHQMSPPWNIVRNIFSGILPWPQVLLLFYSVLDLQSQPFRHRGYLDRISVNGFLRSRFYTSEEMSAFQQNSALQASSIPNYELSAMTSQRTIQAWAAAPEPLFSILNGNLQEKFIAPFETHLRDLGVKIHLQRGVTRLKIKNGQISGLDIGGSGPSIPTGKKDIYVLTTPQEVTRTFVDADVYAAEDSSPNQAPTRLADIVKLQSAPMAALYLVLNRTIDHLPSDHVMLQESRYGLSFIDVSQHWPNLAHTALSIIAANFDALSPLSKADQEAYLVRELQEYIPTLKKSDIAHSSMHPNLDDPLFLNTVGAWKYRPGTRTRIPNLYIAGDYCKSEADLTTMEGAVISALNTARQILTDNGGAADAGPMPLPLFPRWAAALMKVATLPAIAPFGIWNWVRRQIDETFGKP